MGLEGGPGCCVRRSLPGAPASEGGRESDSPSRAAGPRRPPRARFGRPRPSAAPLGFFGNLRGVSGFACALGTARGVRAPAVCRCPPNPHPPGLSLFRDGLPAEEGVAGGGGGAERGRGGRGGLQEDGEELLRRGAEGAVPHGDQDAADGAPAAESAAVREPRGLPPALRGLHGTAAAPAPRPPRARNGGGAPTWRALPRIDAAAKFARARSVGRYHGAPLPGD
eukprot:571808-Prorocentrum_minimum.AAC.1